MPVNVAASVITILALASGIASVFASIRGEFEIAAYWILGAMILDMLDGPVARVTKSVSDFGRELDSLSDMVSFGVAPGVLGYTLYFRTESASESAPIALVFFICAAALRLARYNVYQAERRDLFVGLPSPAAAGTIASFVLFSEWFAFQVPYFIAGAFLIGLGLLMVSTVRYPKQTLSEFVLAPRRAFQFLVLAVAAVAVINYAIEYHPSIVLLPVALAYVLFGIVNEIAAYVGRKRSPASAEDAVPKSAQTTDR